jgi:hypothetical protein
MMPVAITSEKYEGGKFSIPFRANLRMIVVMISRTRCRGFEGEFDLVRFAETSTMSTVLLAWPRPKANLLR